MKHQRELTESAYRLQKVADRIFVATLLGQAILASLIFLGFAVAFSIFQQNEVDAKIRRTFKTLEKQITESVFVEESINGSVTGDHPSAKALASALRIDGIDASVTLGKCESVSGEMQFVLSVGSRNLNSCILISPNLSLLPFGALWVLFIGVISIILISTLWTIVRRRLNTRVLSPLVEKIESSSKEAAIGMLAAQVAHDIRSPLGALNAVASSLDQVPSESRALIRSAVQRINEVADGILHNSKAQVPNARNHTVLLASIVKSAVLEKRTQFAHKPSLRIEYDIATAEESYAYLNPADLKTVLSNLINNSIEAFGDQQGQVKISLRSYPSLVSIVVSDNGMGIPAEVLFRLNDGARVSYGKQGTDSGFGLGLSHARKSVESFKGRFEISSEVGVGTVISMTFPKAMPPIIQEATTVPGPSF